MFPCARHFGVMHSGMKGGATITNGRIYTPRELRVFKKRLDRPIVSVFWEWGYPDLPACGLWCGSRSGPVRPIFVKHKLKTLARGQASRGGRQGASSGTASSGWLARRRRDQGGVPHEVPVTQAMTTKAQAGARRAPACAVSLFPLWCKGSKHRPRHQAKVTISVQQDQDQQNGRMEVTVEPKPASPLEPLTGEDQL